jgi:hypothetical protein
MGPFDGAERRAVTSGPDRFGADPPVSPARLEGEGVSEGEGDSVGEGVASSLRSFEVPRIRSFEFDTVQLPAIETSLPLNFDHIRTPLRPLRLCERKRTRRPDRAVLVLQNPNPPRRRPSGLSEGYGGSSKI